MFTNLPHFLVPLRTIAAQGHTQIRSFFRLQHHCCSTIQAISLRRCKISTSPPACTSAPTVIGKAPASFRSAHSLLHDSLKNSLRTPAYSEYTQQASPNSQRTPDRQRAIAVFRNRLRRLAPSFPIGIEKNRRTAYVHHQALLGITAQMQFSESWRKCSCPTHTCGA